MGKSWKQNTSHAAKKLHGIKDSSIKKNKNPKFKNTPTGKVALIKSKVENKNMKHVSSKKNIQKNFADAKNENQELPKQASKSNAKQLKQDFPNGKQNISNKVENKGKFIYNPEQTLEQFLDQFDDDSDISEEITSQDVSLNDTFEEEDSNTVPDIFGKSLEDESDEDDEDFKEDEEYDSDEEKVECKGVKMFEGLKYKTKNDADEEDQKSADDEGESDENMTFDENDEDDDDEDEDENENDEEQSIKNDQVDSLLMDDDDDDNYDDDDDTNDDDDNYDDDDDDEMDDDDDTNDDDDDYDDDDTDEEMDLRVLLGDIINDDDDDKDFNINSEDEDDKENDHVSKTILEKKVLNQATKKIHNIEDTQVKKEEKTLTLKKGEQDSEWKSIENRLVLVENISKESSIREIIELFSEFGILTKVTVEPLFILCKDPENAKNLESTAEQMSLNLPKIVSFMGKFLYMDEESAMNAVKAMHGKVIDGNYLSVQTFRKFNGKYDTRKTVFITNLRPDVELNEIWKVFRKCGNIDCIELKRNEKLRVCQYGYVHFFTEKAVSSALKLCNVAKIMGQRVKVLRVKFDPNNKDMYRDDRIMSREDWEFKKVNKTAKRILEDREKFQKNLEKSVIPDAKHETKVKKHEKQQKGNEGKKLAFQGQKVNLKNKKKKNKLNKKKKKMAEKLTAKSAKV